MRDMPSKMVNVDTPIVRVTMARNMTPPPRPPPPPPEIWFCQDDVSVRMGPQKKPRPSSGRAVRKTVPAKSVSPGQMSPKPTLVVEHVVQEQQI